LRAGEFEKLTRVTFVWPRAVPGEEFSAKVAESRVAYLKATGAYTDAEATAEEFKAAFKTQSLAPFVSVFFTHSPAGVLTVSTPNPTTRRSIRC
jgi:chalcone isomerase